MNDILDVFLIRFLFVLIICGLIVLYKYIHFILYPSSKNQLSQKFYPSRNPSETIMVFSRILGLGIIFSNFNIFLNQGFFYATFDFILSSTITFSLYLLSIYILESIALSEYEYIDEITQKNNISYAMVSASYSIGIPIIFRAYLTHTVYENSHNIIYIIFMWCFTIVLLGFAVKSYSFVSKLNFNYLLGQKSYALGFSYFGFFLAWVIILASALDQPIVEIKYYGISIILRIILSILIMPIFKGIIPYIFQIKDDLEISTKDEKSQLPSYGLGIYEGVMFMTSAFMTTLVTSNIIFPSF
jgi:hypothetical protein